MSRALLPPRINKWRGKFYLFYYDYAQGRQVRRSCEKLKAWNKEQRIELLKDYTRKNKEAAVEALKPRAETEYDKPLLDAINDYAEDVEARAEARVKNPGARAGISENTAKLIRYTLKRFREFLSSEGLAQLTTADLDARHLENFFRWLAQEGVDNAQRGNRSAATLNRHRRIIATALRWLDGLRPRLFPDSSIFARATKSRGGGSGQPASFSPQQLRAFLTEARKRELPGRKVLVEDSRGRKFEQTALATAETPVSHVFLLLALTGMRLGEALALKWDQVDTKHGRITIYSEKTGRARILPLTGAPEGDVAPGLLKLLKHWKSRRRGREYVLPHAPSTEDSPNPVPRFSRKSWEAVAKAAKAPKISPQRLRQNFVSYCASCGIPSAVAAMWAGHSAAVAEKHYRSQVLDRDRGSSIEAAMGVRTNIPIRSRGNAG